MVLGCFYLTQNRPAQKGQGRVFTDTTEALLAYEHGVIDLQALIKVRLGEGSLVETSAGRIIFNEALPERLRFKNYPMKKENLRQVIADCFKEYGRARTVEL